MLLTTFSGPAANLMGVFMVAPNIFDALPEASRRGVRPNALAMLGEIVASQTGAAFCEYVAASPDGRSIRPVFGGLFTGEDLPRDGRLKVSSAPGFGMEIADRGSLQEFN